MKGWRACSAKYRDVIRRLCYTYPVSRISPFPGLIFDLPRVGTPEQLTSPPYDVISDEQQQRYRALSPHNVVHLEFNDKETNHGSRSELYERSASLLRQWREGSVLLEDEPSYYPYRMDFQLGGTARSIRGLICAVEIEPWGGSIIPHERTLPHTVDDRLGLLRAVQANLSPVYSVFAGPVPQLGELFEELDQPIISLEDHESVTHRLWRSRDERIASWLADQDLLIADGHHRYTTALTFRDEMRELHGPGPWDQIMMLIVDSATEEPPVLPIHRIVSGASLPEPSTNAADLGTLLASLSDDTPTVGITHGSGESASLGPLQLEGGPPAVVALHESILDGSDATLTFVADPEEALRAVTSEQADAAVFLPATTTARIREVIDRGERMPQKSTFFWPKPRTGMVMRSLKPAGPLADRPGAS